MKRGLTREAALRLPLWKVASYILEAVRREADELTTRRAGQVCLLLESRSVLLQEAAEQCIKSRWSRLNSSERAW